MSSEKNGGTAEHEKTNTTQRTEAHKETSNKDGWCPGADIRPRVIKTNNYYPELQIKKNELSVWNQQMMMMMKY